MPRSKRPKINKSQLQAIERLCNRSINSWRQSINAHRALPAHLKDKRVDGQILYFQHCCAAAKFLIEQARRMAQGSSHATSDTRQSA